MSVPSYINTSSLYFHGLTKSPLHTGTLTALLARTDRCCKALGVRVGSRGRIWSVGEGGEGRRGGGGGV